MKSNRSAFDDVNWYEIEPPVYPDVMFEESPVDPELSKFYKNKKLTWWQKGAIVALVIVLIQFVALLVFTMYVIVSQPY